MRQECETCNGTKVVERAGRLSLCWSCGGFGYVILDSHGLAYSPRIWEIEGS